MIIFRIPNLNPNLHRGAYCDTTPELITSYSLSLNSNTVEQFIFPMKLQLPKPEVPLLQ